jgi:DNA helicase-2/ATP-dependent DNA helicase PcrA
MTTPAKLTAAQQRVVESLDGPLKVAAGPGSGKTFTLTRRMLKLVERGVSPDDVLILTFSRKAAQELRRKTAEALGRDAPVYTYHAFAARLVEEYGEAEEPPGLITDAQIWLRLRELARDRPLCGFSGSEIQGIAKTASRFIQRSQQELLAPGDWNEILSRWEPGDEESADEKKRSPSQEKRMLETLVELYAAYQESKRQAEEFDYGDCILEAVRLLWTRPDVRASLAERYRYVMVDEYQDTNLAQGVMVMLVAEAGNVLAVGDEDQGIYAFQGANQRNLVDLGELCALRGLGRPDDLLLDVNFRSVPGIVQATARFRSPEKRLRADREKLEKAPHLVLFEANDEASHAEHVVREILRRIEAGASAGREVTWKDFAVLCSRRSAFRAYERCFRQYGVPFRRPESRLMEQAVVRDVVAYLAYAADPAAEISLVRILESPPLRLAPDAIRAILADKAAPSAEAQARYVALVEQIQDLRSRAPYLGVRWAIRTVVDGTGWTRRVEAGRVEDPDQAAEGIDSLLSLAAEFDAMAGGMDAFVEYVDVLAEEDQTVSALESDEDAVSLLTIHGAKGLEWPVVFVHNAEPLNLPRKRQPQTFALYRDPRTLAWDRLASGAPAEGSASPWTDVARSLPDVLGPTRWPGASAVASEGLVLMKSRDDALHQAEELRLAYVGFTRAMDTLYVGGIKKSGEETSGAEERAPVERTRALVEERPAKAGTKKAQEQAAKRARKYFSTIYDDNVKPYQDADEPVPREWEGEGVRFVSLEKVMADLAVVHPRVAEVEARKVRRQAYREQLETGKVIAPDFLPARERKKFLAELEQLRQEALAQPRPASTRPTLSFSALDLFASCPKRYRLSSEAGLPDPRELTVAGAPALGRRLHSAIEDHAKGRPAADILASLRDSAEAVRQFEAYLETPEARMVLQGDVELEVRLDLDPGVIVGRIDRCVPLPDGTFELIDYKTGKRPASPLQLQLYTLGLRRRVTRASFVYLGLGKRVPVPVDAESLGQAREQVEALLRGVASGEREARPDRDRCFPCPFRQAGCRESAAR